MVENKYDTCIYIGNFTVCEKGAVGTHTKGIIKAFCAAHYFNTVHCIAAETHCLNDISSLVKHNINLQKQSASQNAIAKFQRFRNYVEQVITVVKNIINEQQSNKVLIYHRYDVVVTPLLLKRLRAQKIKCTLVLEYNDLTTSQLKFAAQNGSWSFISRWLRSNAITLSLIEVLERRCFKQANKVVCVTPALCKYVNDSTSDLTKAILIENATDASLLQMQQKFDKQSLRYNLGLPTDKLIFAHVGTLTYWDGLLELLDAFATLQSQHVHFVIVGDGALAQQLDERISKLNLEYMITRLDALPFNEAVKYLFCADAVPLLKTTADYELSPIKYYEALGLGKWLICTDINLINQASQQGFGLCVSFPLVQAEIVDSISKTIKLWQVDATLKSHEITKYAQSRHTWDARVKDMLSQL